MLAYATLMRPVNAVMTALAVFVGALLIYNTAGLDAVLSTPVYLAMLAAFLIVGAGNAINDYMGVAEDRVNKPHRPLPAGKMSPRSALAFAIILFLVGIAIAGFINYIAFIIAGVNSFLLIVYNTHLKERLFIGNIIISYLVGSSFIFGGAAVGNLLLPVILLLLAGVANFAREVVKVIEDLHGDRLGFLKSIAHRAKKKIQKKIAQRFRVEEGKVKHRVQKRHLQTIAAFSLILAIAISPLPYILNILSWSYVLVAALTDLAFAFAIVQLHKARKKQHYRGVSKTIKIGMFLGLIAFIVGVLI